MTGGEFIACILTAYPVVAASFVAASEFKTCRSNPDRRQLLAILNSQVLDEVQVPTHSDVYEVAEEASHSVEVDANGLIL